MSGRVLAALWLVIGLVIFNAFFDLYVSRGAREYLQLRAEADLGIVPPPSMPEVMARAERMGLIAATLWAGAIVAGGWITIRFTAKGRCLRQRPFVMPGAG